MKHSILFFGFPLSIFACPMCTANSNTSEATVYILMGFIALAYIPLIVIYKMIIKSRNINKNAQQKD